MTRVETIAEGVTLYLGDCQEIVPSFQHPARAFYIFGPEDGTLGKAVLDWCPQRVMVPTRMCMNLAATVNVILYDRVAKAMRSARPVASPRHLLQHHSGGEKC